MAIADAPQLQAPLYAVPDAAGADHPRRAGLVARPRLVRRLADAPEGSIAVVVAPAGYGKTTLLRQWEATDARPFTWLDAADVGRLGVAAAPSVVVLDDLRADEPATLRAVGVLAGRLAPGSLLVVASRTEPRLPLGRLRAQGSLVELRADQLAMTTREAFLLLRRAGLALAAEDVATLVAATEGWPAGLRLAALSLCEQHDAGVAVARFGGDDRLVADYLRDELLSGLEPEDAEFVTRTAALGELSGPLCDAVLGRHGSGRVLRDLARSNVMLTPLDRAEERFRYHPMLADMLGAELWRAEPDRALELHRRASRWHEEHGDTARATDHAVAAGDAARAGELLWSIAGTAVGAADPAPIQRSVEHFRDRQIAEHAALALTAAAAAAVGGRRAAAERWVRAAEPALGDARPELQPSLRAGAALLRAVIAPDGLERMAVDAAGGYATATEDSPWRAVASVLAGTAHHLLGDRAAAQAELEEGVRRGALAGASVQAAALAQLALLRLEADDWELGLELALQARELARTLGTDARTAALVFSVSAYACAHGGDVDSACRDALEAHRRLELPGDFAPWFEAETRIALARAELRLSNAAAARTLLARASRALRGSAEAVVLQAWIDDAWARADTFAAGAVHGPAALTTAELRVLRFLPSHLSFREVALRLHVSANTVKTQAHAVYRKLDASSRSEAVARAREVGLVDG